MLVNNPEALKSWLTGVLEPLCDADPSALARYVLALLKKDKPIRELTQCMLEQLDVFLGAETKPFLDKLVAVIQSEDYIKVQTLGVTPSPVPSVPQAPALPPPVLDTIKIVKGPRECTPPLDNKAKEIAEKTSESDISPVQISSVSDGNMSTPSGVSVVECVPKFVPSVEVVAPKENVVPPLNKDTRRRRASMRSRSRSRSRSFERNRKSRSRDRRLAEREKGRQYRKSPISRRYDRRERSPKYAGRIRNRSHSQSRSRSPTPRKMSRSMSPNATGDGAEMRGGAGGPSSKRQRCRDFDEKGYCMRGETCPWDHGVDPVVLEDINNPLIIAQSTGSHMRGVSSEYNPDAPDMWTRGGGYMGPRSGGGPHRGGLSGAGTYPRIPGANFRPGAGFAFPLNPSVTTPLQRELISVPVVDANGPGGDVSAQVKRRFEPEDTVAIAEGPAKRKPIGSRLGPRMSGMAGGGGGGPKTNCSLEIRKVPRGLNSIAHLNNHFSKFGKIVNIQISYDGDPEAAIVTFSEHFEANVAYRSTEAVLNNRFIKVFWHVPGNNIGNQDQHGKDEQQHMQSNQRKPFPPNQYQVNNMPANPVPAADPSQNAHGLTVASTSSGVNAVTTTLTPQMAGVPTSGANAVATAAQLRLKTNRLTRNTAELMRKKQEEKVKAAVQLAHGLHKRKHELLQESLKQMRLAVDRLDRVDSNDPQRPRMMASVKELQDTIEKLREEIAVEQAKIARQTQNLPPGRKSKEQQQKELLDVELELITQQQEGQDTTAIQKKLLEMQRTYRVAPVRTHFPVRSPRVRPAPPGSTSVDRRPTTLYITGFQAEDSDAILGHFKHFGEITKNELDVSIPLLTISFATRLHAEQAMVRGRVFKEKPLQVTWSPKKTDLDTHKVDAIGANVDTIESSDMDTVELRIEDEEEEEDAESEDRSWRR
uniref:Putative rna-binding protein 26-like isoform x4 n=1 Tax=Phlebotomus kandelakii TaxID=1109342 RepID=A0A6B2EFQ0_9DIPT